MMRLPILCFLFAFSSSYTQSSMKQYLGNWEGHLPLSESFHFKIKLQPLTSDTYQLTISNQEVLIEQQLSSTQKDFLELVVDDQTLLKLQWTEQKDGLMGFISSGALMYHIQFNKSEGGDFLGTWNPFFVKKLVPTSVFLAIEQNQDSSIVAYPFFGDQRFSGTWAMGFKQENNLIHFRDFKTGTKFQAKLSENKVQLDLIFFDKVLASVPLLPSKSDWVFGAPDYPKTQRIKTPEDLKDGWEIANIEDSNIHQAPILHLIEAINSGDLPNTHSVLIAKANKLVFEAYFDGHHAHIPHDMRSASKSIASAVIGIVIEDQLLKDIHQKLYDYLPEQFQYTKDSLKSTIKIKDLLTMSSGLDVNGAASEGNYQNSDHWLKTVLEAPMKEKPGNRMLYGSANPFLLGICLEEQLTSPMELYMDQTLLSPLGITNYIMQTDETLSKPYFGGGMHLTSRDMLKFGQLYLNQGRWNGKQILSENWVNQSFQKYGRLEDTKDKNEYGYQWRHKTYKVGKQAIESVEARGNGGQYIFVIPSLESVVVITSGNFRNGALLQQPEKILETYILPSMVK